MAGSLDYLQPLLSSNDEHLFEDYLDFVAESKLFCSNKDKVEEICSTINNLLSSRENSKEGLAILSVFLEQCPKEVLNLHLVSWTQQTVKYLIHPDNGSLSPVAFKVLGCLLDISSNFAEARKVIALNTIPKLLDLFVRESKGRTEDILILKCLEKTLKTYGKSCGSHKEGLWKIIFSQLSSDSPQSVRSAGVCYLQTAASGGPGSQGDNYRTAWLEHEKFLLNALHSLLNQLFANITEENDTHKKHRLDGAHPVFPNVSESSLLKRKQCLAKQFVSLAEFFKILLLGSFPVKKTILAESVLGLVWRGIAVSPLSLNRQQSIDAVSLSTVIAAINLSLIEVLEALIIRLHAEILEKVKNNLFYVELQLVLKGISFVSLCCDDMKTRWKETSCSLNLIGYSGVISRLLSQALEWSQLRDWPFGLTKPHSCLRVKIYVCLEKWLTLTRSCSGIEKYLDDLISSALTDIIFDPPTVSLKVPTGRGKKRLREMKSAAAAAAALQNSSSRCQYLLDPASNADCCQAALRFISALLNTLSTLMDANHHKRLRDALVSRLQALHCGSGEKPSVPYSEASPRLALYQAFLALCQNSHPAFQSSLNYASLFFSQGIKDTSIEVSNFCLFSLRSIEKILHPICPSLEFPTLQSESVSRLNLTDPPSHRVHRQEVVSSARRSAAAAKERDESEAGADLSMNDSRNPQRKRVRRKPDNRITSTPVNGNVARAQFETPSSSVQIPERPKGNLLLNLSDFERGATFNVTNDESLTNDHHQVSSADVEMTDITVSEIAQSQMSNGLEGETGQSPHVPSSPDVVTIEESQNDTPKRRPPSEQLISTKEVCGGVSSEDPQDKSKALQKSTQEEVTPTHKTGDDDSLCIQVEDSDDELLSSFVDEINETN